MSNHDSIFVAIIWAVVVLIVVGGLLGFIRKKARGDFERENKMRDVKWKIKLLKMQHEADRQLEHKAKDNA